MKKIIIVNILLVFTVLMLFTSCKNTSDAAPPQENPKIDSNVKPIVEDITIYGVDEKTAPPDASMQPEGIDTVIDKSGENSLYYGPPKLPAIATSPEAFALADCHLMDYVEMDYNEDGIPDIIGVIEKVNCGPDNDATDWWDTYLYPRILFAAFGIGDGSYVLDFQDVNLIRARCEGGIFGDPYEPLTGERNRFTINAFGGSAWKWRETSTFKYMNDDWYLVYEEYRGNYGPFPNYHTYNDYESGIGYRGYRDSNPYIWADYPVSEENQKYYYSWYDDDLSFIIKVGPPIKLTKASQHSYLARRRVGNIKPAQVNYSDDLDAEMICDDLDDMIFSCDRIVDMDENYILYAFNHGDGDPNYLVIYDRYSGTATALDKSDSRYYSAALAGDMVYFVEAKYEIINAGWDDAQDTLSLENTLLRLIKITYDGTDRETIFEYKLCAFEENNLVLAKPDSCIMCLESVEDGVVVSLDKFSVPDQYYFIDHDTGNARYLGAAKGTPMKWLGEVELTGRIGDCLNIHMKLSINAGRVTGSYYYDKIGASINLTGYYQKGVLELFEQGATGYMLGLTAGGGLVKGVWKDCTMGTASCLPLILAQDWQTIPAFAEPGASINRFAGKWVGSGGAEDRGSIITVVPLFSNIAYVEAISIYDVWKDGNNVRTGHFRSIASLDNDGLNYQPIEKTYPDNETIVFRLIIDNNGELSLYSNDYSYNCGANVFHDNSYTLELS